MKITFIRPNMWAGPAGDALEPLVFAILAGLTPPDVERVLYDERVEAVPFDEPTDLAVLTVETFTARRAYQIAVRYRRRGVPVVMGGHHPTLRPQEALRFASSVAIGEAEGVWAQVIEDARMGTMKRTYQSRPGALTGLALDRGVFAGKRYKPVALVQFGRGCRHACDFCSVHAFYGSDVRCRPVGEVVREIQGLGRRHVFFTDDNLCYSPAALRDLLRALQPLQVRWSCQVTPDLAADRGLVRLMAESGCVSVMIGLESLLAENLRQMRKPRNRESARCEDLVRAFHDHGLMVHGGFVFGYDHDTVDSFKRTLDFAVRTKLFLANFNPLAPTPGTEAYGRLRRENRLLNDPWWLHPAYRYGDSMFHPKGMTAEQLAEGCYWARTEFNRCRSAMHRGLDRRANCRSPYHALLYFGANLVSRREIHRKQGRALGDGPDLELAAEGDGLCD